ncbi:peptidoglycan DD-metalloendopeptidase family protein [Microbulbifer sp. OS29]|uniref:Peptidoglycan DD-metalloendopeptidase family protein n=1 Tax=Microbulbifer okhotskensis TaxID=2926617 RepID=A0A9X2EJK7_9GAMM|nr:peptidoglycan DD-metalloendopeptidase family protein [Microbulbifer okhotskensis]MCO1333422.1 peptidoglycan DD-metalloendopeptidase family protein [Microbulbifer okhotskensis]
MQNHRKSNSSLRIGGLPKHFPRVHALIAGTAAFMLSLAIIIPTPEVAAKRTPLPVNLSAVTSTDEPLPTPAPTFTPAETPLLNVSVEAVKSLSLQVRNGDTLSDLFQRAKISAKEMYQLLGSGSEAKQLARLAPGEELTFQMNNDGQLQSLKLQRDRLSHIEFTRTTSDQFEHALIQREPDSHPAYRQAQIDSSLFLAGSDAGLSDSLIMEMADVFSSDIDFALDIRKDDHFSVMFEEQFLDGEKIGNGPILAVSFTNQGKTFSAVRYVDNSGDANYYTPEGKSMRKAFIRTPLDIVRISSHFNPRRLHPVFKSRRPHNGTDYAAPRGTPVYTTGDGRVIAAGYSKPNGNYVFIQHGERYVTRYLHLTKRKVKRGQRVKQHQVIGTVGSTGYATGPHLHYEFLVDGRHRNPATIVRKLPKAKSVPASEMIRFKNQTQPLLAKLENFQGPALAQLDEDNP